MVTKSDLERRRITPEMESPSCSVGRIGIGFGSRLQPRHYTGFVVMGSCCVPARLRQISEKPTFRPGGH
jgi:hypothetical protein